MQKLVHSEDLNMSCLSLALFQLPLIEPIPLYLDGFIWVWELHNNFSLFSLAPCSIISLHEPIAFTKSNWLLSIPLAYPSFHTWLESPCIPLSLYLYQNPTHSLRKSRWWELEIVTFSVHQQYDKVKITALWLNQWIHTYKAFRAVPKWVLIKLFVSSLCPGYQADFGITWSSGHSGYKKKGYKICSLLFLITRYASFSPILSRSRQPLTYFLVPEICLVLRLNVIPQFFFKGTKFFYHLS